MASVTKHPKSQFWTACYTNREGRQLKRSTKTTDRNEALRIALELESVERKAKGASLTTTQLQKILNDVSQEVLGDTMSVPTTEEYLKDWLETVRVKIAGPTFKRYENTVRLFLENLQHRAKLKVTALTPKDVESFMTARLKSGLAPKTVIVDIKTLSTAFRRAEAYGIILKNPADAVSKPREESTEREVFTLEEVQKLLDAAPDLEWQTLILLGYFLGARLSDCVHMQWDNVHPDEGVIIYHQRKTKKKVTIPMHFHVLEHLSYRSSFETKGYLCPTLVKKVSGGENGLSGAFNRIVKRAGLDLMTVQGKGVRKFSKRTFHSLRHSFNSVLANAGVAEDIRMKLTGHSSRAVHEKYTHLQTDALKKAMDSIPLFNEGTK